MGSNTDKLNITIKKIENMNSAPKNNYRAERHDLKSRLRLFFSLPSKKRGKTKRRMNSKNRDFKSCLSVQSKIRGTNKIFVDCKYNKQKHIAFIVIEQKGMSFDNGF